MIEFVHDLEARRPPPVAATPARRWVALLLASGCALAVYLPAALGASLLDFDDRFFFGPDNPEFRSGFAAVFDPSRPIANAYLPVAHASLWLDWRLAGTSPTWPHVHGLLLHALAGYLLIRFVLQLGAHRGVAYLTGALFLVHPALAESVAWVSGRKDVLCGVFTFAALLQVALFARAPGRLRLVAIVVLTALAMYSKATAVVVPLLAALVCWHVRGPRARWWAPFAMLAVAAASAWHHQRIAAVEGTLVDGSPMARLVQVPGAYWHYLATAVWPDRLNVLYPEVATLERFAAGGNVPVIVLAAVVGLAIVALLRERWRLVGLGLATFLTALLPFNTAYPASSIAAADRYLYLAVPGLALAAMAALAQLRSGRLLPFAVAAVLPLAWLGGSRAHTFADDETLWQTSLLTDADNAVAHLNLVYEQMQRGVDQKGWRSHLEAAARAARYPIHELRARQLLVRFALHDADYARAADEAKRAIAAAEAQLAREASAKRRGEAEELVLAAYLAAFEPLQLAGDDAGAAAALAAAEARAPEHPDVVACRWLRALAALTPELLAKAQTGQEPRLAPDDPRGAEADAALAAAQEKYEAAQPAAATGQVHAGLALAAGEWLRARDQVLPAMKQYQAAQRADPACVAAWLGAARLMRERSMWDAAADYARSGLRVRPDPSLRQELALALVGQGRLSDAEQQLEAYMQTRPGDKDTAKVLANVLIGRAYALLNEPGQRAAVEKLVQRALAHHADDAKAHLVLGRLAKEDRRYELAVHHLERAHQAMPKLGEARTAYTEALAALGYECLLRLDEKGAVLAWQRCVAAAAADFDTTEIRAQLQRVWQKYEGLGVTQMQTGDKQAAAQSFRRCLEILPEQHWGAWLLATALQGEPGADLAELERLCRLAVAWQQQHGLDKSRQVLLLASTLARAGRVEDSRKLAAEYLQAADADAKPQVLQALQTLAGS